MEGLPEPAGVGFQFEALMLLHGSAWLQLSYILTSSHTDYRDTPSAVLEMNREYLTLKMSAQEPKHSATASQIMRLIIRAEIGSR
jgi:hypothetical protein